METKTINVCGEIFESRTEINICEGCAFYDNDDVDHFKCESAIDQFSCIDNQVIWEKVGTKTASGTMSKQVGGSHYQKKIQPWDIIAEWNLDYWRGNVIKYVLRAPEKNGVEDIKKAIHYLEYIVENYVKDRK